MAQGGRTQSGLGRVSDPRSAILKAATADLEWDVIVIGGGASGLGAAVEAASRGYKTLLLEGHDYAKGTSSRSTKLVHGGVRYLTQGHLHLVRESLHERGVLKRNAPHLVHDLGFLIAAYRSWRIPFYGAGLKLYDLLAGALNLRPSRALGRRQALAEIPTLKAQHLKGGVLYFDGQFDDSRLAITLLRTFEDLGGVALNAAPVTGFARGERRINGVTFTDTETGQTYTAKGRAVINAAGIFACARWTIRTPFPCCRPARACTSLLRSIFYPGARR
jgi:glycerol-3-phosphate dehydrogenase